MLWTLKIKLLRYAPEWSAEIEIDSASTLDDLHFAIQKAVHFDNDHLYAFYIARSDRTRSRMYFDEDDDRVFSTELSDMFPLPPKMSLFYLFDFGDEWVFKVTKTRKKPQDPQQGVAYPRVVKEVGTRPKQYRSFDE